MAQAPRVPKHWVPRVDDRPLEAVRDEAEAQHILSVLRRVGGHRGQAARILRISRKTLWKKLKHLDLQPPRVTER